ncbi:MAG: hypothetical protein JNK15_02795 [Planctomycetes bacterium]|nr:hypothetical protein [Planctomycetota bacterium]
MSGTRTMFGLLVLVLGLAACADPVVDPAEEVAAELRALRMQLAAQAAAPVPHPAAVAPAVDPKELLQPLREVLAGLQVNQQELAARQTALAQEMQRWSQLLVTSLGEKHAEQAKAMSARIAALEQSLQQQDARHKEVESLLQGALERTADRLEQFLQRLPGAGGGEQPATAPAGGAKPAAEPKGPGAGSGQPDGSGDGSGQRTVAARLRNQGTRWWWLGITGLGCSVAAFFLRRAWRLGGSAGPRSDLVAEAEPGVVATPTQPPEQSVEELWATAALLGEAVERLRQQQSAPAVPTVGLAPAPEAVAEPVAEAFDLDELYVLDDEPMAAAPASAPTAPPAPSEPPAVPAKASGRGPEFVTVRLAAAKPEAVLALLAQTPFVLRRPAPTATRVDGWLEVAFAVLPGTAAGERARLVQALREAGR